MSTVIQGTASGGYEKRNPQERYEGVYGKIQFPRAPFQEFPKWIRGKGGREQLVATAREELEVLTKWGTEAEVLGDGAPPSEHSEISNAIAVITEKQATIEAKDRELEALKAQLAELTKPKAAAPAPVAAPPAPPVDKPVVTVTAGKKA